MSVHLATLEVIEIITPFDIITVTNIHELLEKGRMKRKQKEMSSGNEGEGMPYP